MENDLESFTSPRESPGQFFVIGKRLLFSTSSISLSPEDLKSLEAEVNKLDEEDVQDEAEAKADEAEAEAEAGEAEAQAGEAEAKATIPERCSASDAEPKSNEALGMPWSGFIRTLKKGPTMNFQAFQSNMPHLPSFRFSVSKRRGAREVPSLSEIPSNLDTELFHCFHTSWINFTLHQLKEATDNFSRGNIIGEGGYSEVYKGHLKDGRIVAVKRLTRGTAEEMTADYLSELGILVHVNHPNIANVIGYCVEGGMHIILPLSVNGSLSSLLKGGKEKLTWSLRYNIALGIASGLSYLHEGCQRRIIHRDIKSANILLTEYFEPMISDFGLAKWLPDQWTHLTASHFEGTFGYLPPEFFMHGIVDEKTDIFAFGVILLELISGRPAIDEANKSLVMWASKNTTGIVDPSLGGIYDSEQLSRMLMVASSCVHQDPAERPQMSQAARRLKGPEGILHSKGKFQKRVALKRPHLELISEFECIDRVPKSEAALDQELHHQDVGSNL